MLKRFVRPAGLVLGIVALAAFAWYAARVLEGSDLTRFATARGAAAVAVAALFYGTIIPLTAIAWRTLLRGMDEARDLRPLTEILAISQFAKYIPGNVGVHLGRAGMALARGMHARAVVASLLVEGLLAVAAALVVGAIGLALSGVGAQVLADGPLRSGVVAATGILFAVAAVGFALRFAPQSLRKRLAAHHAWPPAGAMVRAGLVYAVNYVVIAIGMWAMATLMFPDRSHDLGLLAAAFALAWVAGFFAPGAPAGLGVREALMLILLRAAYAPADALMLVVGMRLATILADGLIFLAGNAAVVQSRRRARAA